MGGLTERALSSFINCLQDGKADEYAKIFIDMFLESVDHYGTIYKNKR